jgi:alanine racemase
MYGYGRAGLLPIMRIESFVEKIFYASAGEHIGYGTKFEVKRDGFYAIVPVGYGDGLRRNLSGKFYVSINGIKYKSVGNICMDAFFVKVDKNVKVGDKVVVMENAEQFAKKINTISYEILTGFSNFRGKTEII